MPQEAELSPKRGGIHPKGAELPKKDRAYSKGIQHAKEGNA